GLDFPTDVAMHPLMRSVVLGMTRATPFQINPQRNPPSRQPTQAQNSMHAGEGRAVVAADRLWQPGSLKESLQTLPHLFRAGHLSMTTQIQLPNLARSPAQMCQLQAHYLAQLFLRQLLRTVSRPARLFFHPAHPVA